MSHPQNSPRGRFSKAKIVSGDQSLVGNSTGMQLGAGLALSARSSYATEDSSGNFLLPAGLALSAKTAKFITQNSTGAIFPTVAAKPSARSSCKIAFLTNTTGKNYLAINTTGATWNYLQVTSVQPTIGY
jgi:hypothetical protein